MKKYLSPVKKRVSQNFVLKFMQIPREENEHANRLAKIAYVEHMSINNQVLSFIQYSLAIKEVDVQVIPIGVDLMTLIVSYLKKGTVLEDHNAS